MCGDPLPLRGHEASVHVLRGKNLGEIIRRDGVRVNDDDRASLHPLIEHLSRARARVPQQRDAPTPNRSRRAGASQGLVAGLEEQRGSVNNEGVRLGGDFCEAVHRALQGTIPREGEILGGLGENVGPGVQCVGRL